MACPPGGAPVLRAGWASGAALLALLAACASPGGGPGDAPRIADAPAVESSPAGPRFSAGGPDADAHGAREGYPTAVFHRMPYLVGMLSHHDQLFEGRRVRRAARPWALARAAAEPVWRYEHEGRTLTVDDYLRRNPVTGLLLAQGDTILLERYQYARHDRHRLASFSMAKSVTAVLVGIAIADGHIRSVDDAAATYAPALADTAYGRISLRHLLQMSSGIRFSEVYSGRDDVARLYGDTVGQASAGGAEVVKPYTERLRSSGSKFAYASIETQVVGLALRGAIGRPIVDYLHEKVWEPMGAEADATWLVDRSGQEATYCCINAVLRDYARLGLVLAHDGRRGDRQIIPRDWLRDATTVLPDDWHLKPYAATAYFGYGYQTWIFPGARRQFALLGFHGQAIFVDPTSRIVLVHTAAFPEQAPYAEAIAMWRAAVEQIGTGSTRPARGGAAPGVTPQTVSRTPRR